MTHTKQEDCTAIKCDAHLQDTRDLSGDKLAATDGEIGHVKDFYFDDEVWVIRYLIADTGSWLPERLVLISPHALGDLEKHEKLLHVKLSKVQIQNSPSIETHRPVSRQYEVEYYNYYGWPAYWNGGAMWGFSGFPLIMQPTKDEMDSLRQYRHRDDKHLRSTKAVTGYHIQTLDGMIGHVIGFLIDDRTWAIRKLVVEAGHWYSGKTIQIPTDKVSRISYEESKVFVNLSKEDIQQTAEDKTVHACV